jgi:Rrf2 family protein
MLALTKKTDYALIALSHLAKNEDAVISARTLAKISGIPFSILTNIMKELAHASIVKSERGPHGGYTLARPSDAISLHELITTIEGPFQFVQCMLTDSEESKRSCELTASCPIRTPAYKIHQHFRRFLENVSLAEIVTENGSSDAASQVDVLTNEHKLTALTELSA